ncbi:MAG TPA: CHAT domain-containing protein [Blastocatellia bacterium]|jgi:CHAT domain-containing protein/Tfp pilus assembly protein PilF|nr:CHAT domain-containing protein [Blastocatellia bacterium]
MAQNSSASRARRPVVNFRLGLILVLSLATAPAVAQDGARSHDRVSADQAFAEGERLWMEGTEASRLQAIEKYREALALWRALGDRSGEVEAIIRIGSAYYDLVDYRKATEYWELAAPIERELENHRDEAALLINIGVAYARMYENERALDSLTQAAPMARAAGDLRREARARDWLASLYSSAGDAQKAFEQWRQTLQIWRELNDPMGQGRVLYQMGAYYDDLGEKQKAIEYLQEALPLLREQGDTRTVAGALYRLGLTYDSIREREKAVACFKEGLELRKTAGHEDGEGANLWSLGNFYDGLGEKQEAIDHFTRALPLLQAEKNYHGVVSVLRNLGLAYESIGERRKALEYFNRALAIVKLSNYRQVQGRLLADMGKLLCEIGEYEQALELLNRALPIIRDMGERFFEVYALHWMARAERGRGNLLAAQALIAEAIGKIERLRPTVNSPELRASAFSRAQEIYEFEIDTLMQLQKRRPAENYDAAALRANEQARAREMLAMLAEAHAEIRQGVDPDLLARERSLREQLNAQANRLTFLLGGKRDEAQIEAARRELDALETEYQRTQAQIRETSPRYAALNFPQPLSLSEIQQQVLDPDTLLLEYALGEERSYVWVVTTDSMTSHELRGRGEIERAAQRLYDLLTARNRWIKFETADERKARVAHADAESPQAAEALAQMVLGPVADRLTRKRLLIVSDGALQYAPFAALPLPETGRLGDLATGRQDDTYSSSASSRPYATLSFHRPVAPSPSRQVAYRPLIVDHEIVTLPSASTLAVLRRELEGRKPAPKTVAVLADPVFDRNDERFKTSFGATLAGAVTKPVLTVKTRGGETDSDLVRSAEDIGLAGQGFHLARLQFTRKEARAILSFAPERERFEALDFAASLLTVSKPELAQYRYVHFATHGLLNSLRPELSGIVLSLIDEQGADQDGFLRAHEIFDLRLPAEMVVLSGCQTGLGREIKGEGLVGLTRGFMYAGAARVMVSLWGVNDQATSQLMARIYQGLLGGRRMSPAAALREAQVSFWRDRRWNAPYYWAAFTLQGEPR